MSKYDAYLPETLQEAYVAAINDDEYMSLKGELALIRSLLAKYIKDGDGEVDSIFIKDVTKLLDRVQHTQEAISRHESRMREVLPIKMVPLIISGIVSILQRRISDKSLIEQVRQDIGNIPLLFEHKPVDAEVS
jgi:hypothetical protein